ncbi:ribbon-helix-helix protein, CopG family [Stygiolobus caldivivus]|uniref:Ribbon-helix-helix protein CopG domain-containing protein n=1 Tax=Stygiolobus caldivivus TaxID=2824673 RepID=A0A8D5ZKB4_9CREN|nr:ribbon-helix-helix protein, CopG family [Stygiolobus caldivivus]BCU71566.1 hypothetical protein KN1_28630 [Stygiolobus caldivivus]
MKKVITFKVEDDVIKDLDTYAQKHGLNRSEVIRKAILKLIEEDKN